MDRNAHADLPNAYPILAIDDAQISESGCESLEPRPFVGARGLSRFPGSTIELNPEPVEDEFIFQPGWPIGESVALRKPRKRDNQKVLIGNNKTGRMGKLRCHICRRRHSKCQFDSIDLPCTACQKEGLTSCNKTMGPGSKQLVKSNTVAPTIDFLPVEFRSAFYPPEPSRPPPTAIDAVIDDCEVQMLQFIYTLESRYRYRDHHAHWDILTQIIRRLSIDHGPSINDHSLRAALLACAGAVMFVDGHSEYEQHLDEYSNRVIQVLMRKDPTSTEPEDYFLVFFLAIAESFRFCCYQNSSRPASDINRARRALSIHVRGSLTITKYLSSGPDVAIAKRFGQIWLYAQDLLALWGIYADPGEVVELAALYRHQLSKVQIEYENSSDAISRGQLVKATAATASAFGNFVVSLSRIVLGGFIVEEVDTVQMTAVSEIKRYLCFPDDASDFWTEVTSSCTSSRDRHYETLQLLASKVILHVTKEPPFVPSPEGFMWAKELLNVAQSFHDESLSRNYEDFGCQIPNESGLQSWDERAAVFFVSIASLVVPPASVECLHHRGAVIRFLRACGAFEMSKEVEQYWKTLERIHFNGLVGMITDFFE